MTTCKNCEVEFDSRDTDFPGCHDRNAHIMADVCIKNLKEKVAAQNFELARYVKLLKIY